MSEPGDYVIRSVTIAEVLDNDGQRAITFDTEGEPSDWDVLGLLEYAAAVIRNRACLDTDDDDLICLIAAAVCFGLAAVNVPVRVNLIALGLLAWILVPLVALVQAT